MKKSHVASQISFKPIQLLTEKYTRLNGAEMKINLNKMTTPLAPSVVMIPQIKLCVVGIQTMRKYLHQEDLYTTNIMQYIMNENVFHPECVAWIKCDCLCSISKHSEHQTSVPMIQMSMAAYHINETNTFDVHCTTVTPDDYRHRSFIQQSDLFKYKSSSLMVGQNKWKIEMIIPINRENVANDLMLEWDILMNFSGTCKRMGINGVYDMKASLSYKNITNKQGSI